MKRIRSTMAMCIATLLAFSNFPVMSIYAEGSPTIRVSSESVETGEEAVIVVSMDNNPGVSAWQVLIDYDSDAMTLKNAEGGAFSNISFGDFSNVPFSSIWLDSQTKDDIINGNMLTLTFDIKETAKAGSYPITLKYEEDWISNKNDISVPFDVINGSVTVKEKKVNVTGLTIAPEKIEFNKAGETKTIVPTILPENATNKKVTYKSTENSVATVDENGKVTAVGEGTTEIVVTSDDGGYTAKCVVTVAHQHMMKKIEAKSSTCTEQGNNEYFYCSGCKKYFKDEQGVNSTTPDAEKRDLANHNFTAKNTDAKYLKTEATCISEATYYYSCSVCGTAGTDSFKYGNVDKNNHVGDTEIINAKEAKCNEEGYTGDTVCKSCKEVIEKGKIIPAAEHNYSEEWKHDEKSHWRECTVGCGTIIDKADHKGGEATCISEAVCEVCGVKYGSTDPDNHKGKTEIRGYIAPSADKEGYTGDTYCLDCGKIIKSGESIPIHIHQLKKVDAVAATHFAEGNIEYYVCEEDGMKFADAEATKPLTDEEIVVSVIPHTFGEEWKSDESKHWHECECGEKDAEADHSFGDWKVVTAATENAEGLEERECTVCGAKETKTINKLDPSSNPSSQDSSSEDSSSKDSSSKDSSSKDSSSKDSSSKDSNSSGNSSSKNPSNNNSGNNSKSNTNNGSTSAMANGSGNANPNTGMTTSVTALGVLALSAIVVSKKKK